MPAKAGIQALLLESRQGLSPQALGGEHAGMTTGDNGHFFLRCCAKKQALTWRGKAGRTLKSAAKIVGTFAKDGFRMRTTARVRIRVRKTFQNP